MKSIDELSGKRALVTGASRGVGRGIAEVLAEKGVDVCINYFQDAGAAQEVAEHVRHCGRQALVAQADVSNPEDVERMFKTIRSEFGGLDILVSNAGTTQDKDIFSIEIDDWQKILKTNLDSVFLCSKLAVELMSKQGDGRIVNISSVVAHRGAIRGHVHYATTKSGILGFTRTLARTTAPYGIRVNAVAPGVIQTELLMKTHGEKGVRRLEEGIPLGIGTPRDVGLAVAFLCGEGGRYITGATIDIDGGLHMR
jgi:NAD(P)-dependent dehydrogenase (short-subunit alcohol dehydrogenase family)